jgi:dihydroorotase
MYLVRQVTIIDPASSHHGQKKDILIDNGIITAIDKSINPIAIGKNTDIVIIDADGAFVSTGWFDLRCRLGDPGLEQREDMESGTRAAAAGGFTDIACLPDTVPVLQSKSEIDYIISRSNKSLTTVYPLGAVTKDLDGIELTEMYDMQQSGAVAFSNADHPFADSGVLYRAMMYGKAFGVKIMSHAEDKSISRGGSVNESATTVNTGLKSIPDLSEFGKIQSELEVAAYADSPIHFSHISTAKSVDLIRAAKKKGVSVTCDVAIVNLVFTDEKTETFDSAYKVMPPLRTETDRLALIAGIKDGTIDAIVTDHNPLNSELKTVEFDYASFGIIGFQTFYPLYNQFLSGILPLEIFIDKITNSPRKLLGLVTTKIEVNSDACLTVFHPTEEWRFERNSNFSRSINSPMWEHQLKGKILFVTNKNKFYKSHF